MIEGSGFDGYCLNEIGSDVDKREEVIGERGVVGDGEIREDMRGDRELQGG